MTGQFETTISAEDKGKRLDLWLASLAEIGLSRSQIKHLIDNGAVRVNGEATKSGYKTREGDRISLIPSAPQGNEVKAENIQLDVIFEDDELIVVNKPRGMVVHPAPGNYSGTLVNALLNRTDKLASLGAPLRPGIVHRLDKDTSGLIAVAKTDQAYYSLVKQLKDRTVEKTYLTLVHGVVKGNEGVIKARIGRNPIDRKKMAVIESSKFSVLSSKSEVKNLKSREAITEYKVKERFKHYTLLEVKIKTGRTHQIRVHLSHIGHSVVGDQTYGKKKEELQLNGQLLHAQKLTFAHPTTGKKVQFEAKIPAEMEAMLKKLRSE